MRYFRYIEPMVVDFWYAVDVYISEQEILDQYFSCWSERMKEIGKEDEISEDNCIEDWVIVNWATEVTSGVTDVE